MHKDEYSRQKKLVLRMTESMKTLDAQWNEADKELKKLKMIIMNKPQKDRLNVLLKRNEELKDTIEKLHYVKEKLTFELQFATIDKE